MTETIYCIHSQDVRLRYINHSSHCQLVYTIIVIVLGCVTRTERVCAIFNDLQFQSHDTLSVLCISFQWPALYCNGWRFAQKKTANFVLNQYQICSDDDLLTGVIYLQRFLSFQDKDSDLRAARPLPTEELLIKDDPFQSFWFLLATSMWTAIKYNTDQSLHRIHAPWVYARSFYVDPER